jgi:hypothetical protein
MLFDTGRYFRCGKPFSILKRINVYVQANKIQHLHRRNDCRNNYNWRTSFYGTNM